MTLPLNAKALAALPANVSGPAYDRASLTPGFLHIGVGNFHRAHMAVYLDRLFALGQDHNWAIVGAGVRSNDAAMRDRLAAQDWLTTVDFSDGPFLRDSRALLSCNGPARSRCYVHFARTPGPLRAHAPSVSLGLLLDWSHRSMPWATIMRAGWPALPYTTPRVSDAKNRWSWIRCGWSRRHVPVLSPSCQPMVRSRRQRHASCERTP
jgi:hypothetical protein